MTTDVPLERSWRPRSSPLLWAATVELHSQLANPRSTRSCSAARGAEGLHRAVSGEGVRLSSADEHLPLPLSFLALTELSASTLTFLLSKVFHC